MELKDLSDEELVLMAQAQNSIAIDILLERYKSVAAARARAYFLNGGDEQDLVQEGMIAVFNAILNFNGKSNFKNYALTAVNNRIISVIKKYSRLKNLPLNNYISLSGFIEGATDKTEFMVDEKLGPEEILINGESVKELNSIIHNTLSKLEFKILSCYLRGDSYADISVQLNKDKKSIDNALQRIRKKLQNVLKIN